MPLEDLALLLVDDHPDIRTLFSLILSEAGAEVRTACSGQEALVMLTEFTPAVLLTNIAMPDMDGFDLLSQARTQGLTMPAIAMTGFARAQDRERALSAGFNDYLIKPVELDTLVAAVCSLCGRTAE